MLTSRRPMTSLRSERQYGRRAWPLFILASILVLSALALPGEARAQYKNQQFGFEGGYQFVDDDSQLAPHNGFFGLRAGYKSSDHWWFTARAMVSFRGDRIQGANTAILFHLTPIDVRYYLWTDDFRPFIGGATTFHFVANSDVQSAVHWGLGPVIGTEIKLRRDLFLGFQVDGQYFFAFDGDEYEAFHATTQLIFFL